MGLMLADDAMAQALRASAKLASPIMLVASTGGHLSELRRLIDRYEYSGPTRWITFDTEQSRSLLAGEVVTYLPYVRSRDLVGTLKAIRPVLRAIRADQTTLVISTGAAIAISAFIAAKSRRVPALYVESAARVTAPSSTGRIVSSFKLAATASQTSRWQRWEQIPSVFGDFTKIDRAPMELTRPPLKVLVSLGTIRPYRFDRAVNAVLRELPKGASVIWQLGSTTRSDLDNAVSTVTQNSLRLLMTEVDVVITHCGVGSVLEALEVGKVPIVIPRSSLLGEHVDDHQSQLASYLRETDVAIVRTPDELKQEDLEEASRVEASPLRSTP